jgi:DNA polymerase III delta subunit
MSYKTYEAQFKKALDPDHPNTFPLMVIRGVSDFMLNLTLNSLRVHWNAQGWAIEWIDGTLFTAERFLQSVATRSMFEPRQITLVRQAFASNDLADCLKSLVTTRSFQPALVLVGTGEIPARFAKELGRLAAFTISCDEPAAWEIKDFLRDRCQVHKLDLNPESQNLFLEAVGGDLAKIENELRKLALICPDGRVTVEAIRAHVDFLREDSAFRLDELLCKQNYPQAMLLVKGLIDRGESSLSVLAILSMHCRKAIQIHARLRAGLTPVQIGQELRLPLQVVQLYGPYLRSKDATVFQRALNLCHDADRKLKSIRHGEETWLQRIVWELMA